MSEPFVLNIQLPTVPSQNEWLGIIAASEVVRTKPQPTAAQCKWLHAIASGEVVRQSNASTSPLVRRSTQRVRRSSYLTTCDLRNAGWIEQKRDPMNRSTWKIVLTDAGRLAIGISESLSLQGSPS